jgi:hypothetical protein
VRLQENVAQMISLKAEEVFFSPKQLYKYEDIVNGTFTEKGDGSFKKEKAIFTNTIRAFHRLDKNRPSIAQDIDNYFITNKNHIINELIDIISEEGLHRFENNLCNNIKGLPNLNIDKYKLYEYNLIRKPVDLFIEHLVLLAYELNNKRNELIPFLFIPLDKWILSERNEYCFFDTDLRFYGIREGAGFTSIKDEDVYVKLQALLNRNAKFLTNLTGKYFYRIYFELLWRDRYRNKGGNIWEMIY